MISGLEAISKQINTIKDLGKNGNNKKKKVSKMDEKISKLVEKDQQNGRHIQQETEVLLLKNGNGENN